jgi:HSP20 family protein
MDMTKTVVAGDTPLWLDQAEESEAERVFKHFFSQSNLFSSIPHNVWSPPTDVYATPDKYVVRIEIPGIQDVRKNVTVQLTDNVLTVCGYRRDCCTDKKLGFEQMEIHYGYFEKVVTLSHDIDAESLAGMYDRGFLCISIDKAAK